MAAKVARGKPPPTGAFAADRISMPPPLDGCWYVAGARWLLLSGVLSSPPPWGRKTRYPREEREELMVVMGS